jgi:NAD(P)-dependent dehydrogenase (short-subunit alcohol dehydrogenase family)
MSRVFITGSADGLGQMAAKLLVAEGHRVVLHARSPDRAGDDAAAMGTGQYFYLLRPRISRASVRDPKVQDPLLPACADLSGVTLSTES